jgi:predicted CopG family antitoxin
MCSIVGISGIDFNTFDFKEDNWYHKFQWTKAQEKKFVDWLNKYLWEDKNARKEFMAYPKKSKGEIEKVVNEFICNYGWKTTDEEEI